MNRLPLLKLLLIIVFLSLFSATIFISCRKNDLSYEKKIVLFADQFFQVKTAVQNDVKELIEKLKLQNAKSGFVEKISRNYGLPIWEKAGYALNSNSSNSFMDSITSGNDIYIPMTTSYYGLSAIIVAQWQTDSFNIKFYSKDYLYNVCHADALDTAKAENLLTLFFALENYCFGSTDFYHIPASLFQKSTEIDRHGDKIIRIKDNSPNQSTNSLILCVTFYHCINSSPCNGWYCDRCPLCETIRCFNQDEGPPGGGNPPGGGQGGGGQGGGGNPGGGPPNCGQVFYLVNPCGPPPPNPPLTPCQRAFQACQIATDIFRRQEMQSRKAEMTANFLPNREKCFWFGKANVGDTAYTTTNIVTGDTGTSITVTPFPPSTLGQLAITYGAAHAHTTEHFPAPSPGDMYNYAWITSQNPNFKFFTFSPGQSDYAFVISDSISLRNFALNWLPTIYLDSATGDWKENTEIFEKSDVVFRYFIDIGKTEDEAMELAQAFIAYQYQTGIAIAKMDAQGNFKPIFVKEMPDPLDPSKKIYLQTTVCNLNTIIIE